MTYLHLSSFPIARHLTEYEISFSFLGKKRTQINNLFFCKHFFSLPLTWRWRCCYCLFHRVLFACLKAFCVVREICLILYIFLLSLSCLCYLLETIHLSFIMDKNNFMLDPSSRRKILANLISDKSVISISLFLFLFFLIVSKISKGSKYFPTTTTILSYMWWC